MPLNPNIILSMRQPNFLATIDQANRASAFQGEVQHQNAFRNAMQQHGPGIMAGDQESMNVFAQFDPQAALGAQSTRQSMAISAERLEMAKQEAARIAERETRDISNEQAAEAAAKMKSIWLDLSVAPDEQTYNALAMQHGIDPAQAPLKEREINAAKAAGYISVLEAKKATQPERTAKQKDYDFFIEQGLSEEQALASVKGGVTVNTGDNELDPFQRKMAEAEGEAFVKLLEQGDPALRNIQRLDQLEGLLENVDTGLGASFKASLGNLGIPTEGLSEIQAAQALINQMVPEQRQPGSGPMSDADLALFKQSVPRLINQPGGNKKIIQTIRQINEYDAKLAEIVGKVASGALTREQARAEIRSMQNPLENFASKIGSVTRKEEVIDGYTIKEID